MRHVSTISANTYREQIVLEDHLRRLRGANSSVKLTKKFVTSGMHTISGLRLLVHLYTIK
jgi:hypothetical protein